MNYRFINSRIIGSTEKIALVELNNTEKHNALSSDMLRELIKVFKAFERAKEIKVIILTAKSQGVWSAGHNLNELNGDFDPMSRTSPYKQYIRLLKSYSKAVIAAVDGSVWGGAVEIVFLCDIILATTRTKFYLTALKIGFPYDTEGISNLVSVLGDKLLRELFFTAQPLTSQRALQLGIINRLTGTKKLLPTAREIASKIAKNSGAALALVKKQISYIRQPALSERKVRDVNSLRRKILSLKYNN
ncbi:MAG: enoyl-CoA hydratase-related protein [Ignavibacteria bacterium]